jgi:hypothetical protein
MYQAGMHVPEISRELGCHRQTVYTALEKAGIERRDDRLTNPGVARRTHCKRGAHELTGDNVRTDGRGYRHCKACEQTRYYLKRAERGLI